MARFYRLKYSPLPQTDEVLRESFSSEEDWMSKYGNSAVLAIKGPDGTWTDISEWVLENKISHEEYDGEKSGRDPKKGIMKRYYIATKHKMQIKILDRIPQPVVHYIFTLIDSDKSEKRFFFKVKYQCPCPDVGVWEQTFYCATINFGAQRYNKFEDVCYYYGMNFNFTEK